MTGEARVRAFFAGRGVPKEIVRFGETTENSVLAARTLGVDVGMIAKSILFIADGAPVMVVISGDRRVDTRKLRSLTGARKVRMADAGEVLSATGFAVGGVSPVGHATAFPVFMDASLERFAEIYPAAGEHNNMFRTSFRELAAMTGGSRCDVAKEEQQ